MPVVTLTQRFLAPPEEASYSVRTVEIPPAQLAVPQTLIRQFGVPPERAAQWCRQAANARQPGTWLQPHTWSGAVALLICGAGDNRHAFKWLLFRRLLERNIAVLTVDPPGHGDFVSVPCTVDNARRAARAALDWLCAQPGVQRVGAIGISFGGNQALDLAAHDERVMALVTISTPVKLPPVTPVTVARELLGLVCLPRNLALLRYQSLRKMWAEWRSVKGAWFGESLYDMIARFDAPQAVRAIGRRSKMFVHGKCDVAVPPINAKWLYEASEPERELLLVAQATHLSVILFDKEVTQMADWLAAKLVHTSSP
ncbi:MAG: alpha/beta hydrolase [Chloroflexi bacterium]|nr:MAG: alpha/beta hydrolase [Chloroflexota bacterium]